MHHSLFVEERNMTLFSILQIVAVPPGLLASSAYGFDVAFELRVARFGRALHNIPTLLHTINYTTSNFASPVRCHKKDSL